MGMLFYGFICRDIQQDCFKINLMLLCGLDVPGNIEPPQILMILQLIY